MNDSTQNGGSDRKQIAKAYAAAGFAERMEMYAPADTETKAWMNHIETIEQAA